MRWLVLALAFTAPLDIPALSAPPRGRDPWVFRLILEEKTRMVVVALSTDQWLAYNPANGALYKAWGGAMEYRGKVWDFSQECSWARGIVFDEQEDWIIVERETDALPTGWDARDVMPGADGWTFTGDDAELTSPVIDLTQHEQVMVSFEERSRAGPIVVEVSDDGGLTWAGQRFHSTTHGSSNSGWQKNMKLLEAQGPAVRVRFRQLDQDHGKAIRRVTIHGDRRVWSARRGGQPLELNVDWRGYRLIERTEGVELRFGLVLADGSTVHITEHPEAIPRRHDDGPIGLDRRFMVSGLPEGVSLRLQLTGRAGAADCSVEGGGVLIDEDGQATLEIADDGESVVTMLWRIAR